VPGVAGPVAAARVASPAHPMAAAAVAPSRAVPLPAAPHPPIPPPTPPVILHPPTPPPILIGGPVRLPPPSQLGIGQRGPTFGSVVQPALGLRGRLPPFAPSAPAVGLSAPAITPASVPIGRYLGGRVFGPPVPVLQQPPVQRAIARAGGPPLFSTAVWPALPPMTMAAAAANAAQAATASTVQNAANAALAQTLGTPTQRILGGPVALAWPLGMMQIANIPNAVVQNQAAIVRGLTVMPSFYGLPLTRFVNAVRTPVVTRTVTPPTAVPLMRTIGNIGTRTIGNIRGGVTIGGPQGTIFLPAQQLLTAAA